MPPDLILGGVDRGLDAIADLARMREHLLVLTIEIGPGPGSAAPRYRTAWFHAVIDLSGLRACLVRREIVRIVRPDASDPLGPPLGAYEPAERSTALTQQEVMQVLVEIVADEFRILTIKPRG